jgi:hypothetical protein
MAILICLTLAWFASLSCVAYALLAGASATFIEASVASLWAFSLLLIVYAIHTAVTNKD